MRRLFNRIVWTRCPCGCGLSMTRLERIRRHLPTTDETLYWGVVVFTVACAGCIAIWALGHA